MSIEAVWLAKFGDVSNPLSLANGGVVILDTQRVYGGDSAYAYRGTYKLDGGAISGEVTIHRHNPDPSFADVWGTGADAVRFEFAGQWEGDQVLAVMSGPGGLVVGLKLERFLDL